MSPGLRSAPAQRAGCWCRPHLGPGLMGPLVWGTDRMLAWGAEGKGVQPSAPENTCMLLLALSIKFTLGK